MTQSSMIYFSFFCEQLAQRKSEDEFWILLQVNTNLWNTKQNALLQVIKALGSHEWQYEPERCRNVHTDAQNYFRVRLTLKFVWVCFLWEAFPYCRWITSSAPQRSLQGVWHGTLYSIYLNLAKRSSMTKSSLLAVLTNGGLLFPPFFCKQNQRQSGTNSGLHAANALKQQH